jgi:hypothetical protein
VRQATRLVTSSEDDASPVIMVWDLRNARAPEKVGGDFFHIVHRLNICTSLDRSSLVTRRACCHCHGVNRMRTFFCLVARIIAHCVGILRRQRSSARFVTRCSHYLIVNTADSCLPQITGPSRLSGALVTLTFWPPLSSMAPLVSIPSNPLMRVLQEICL